MCSVCYNIIFLIVVWTSPREREITVYEMTLVESAVDKITVVKITVDAMPVEEKSIDQQLKIK
jgi:hypothetical protein